MAKKLANLKSVNILVILEAIATQNPKTSANICTKVKTKNILLIQVRIFLALKLVWTQANDQTCRLILWVGTSQTKKKLKKKKDYNAEWKVFRVLLKENIWNKQQHC